MNSSTEVKDWEKECPHWVCDGSCTEELIKELVEEFKKEATKEKIDGLVVYSISKLALDELLEKIR